MSDGDGREYRGLEFSIFAGAFVLGIAISALGSMLPALFPVIGYQKADAGSLFLAMNLAMLIGSLLFGPVCDRFGFRILLLSSTFLVAGAFVLIAFAAGYRELVTALLTLGLGAGALNGAINALLNDISPDRRQHALNLLGLYFGCGALFTPFVVGSALETFGLRPILSGLTLLSLGPFVLFLLVEFPAPKHARGFSRSDLTALFRSPLLFLFGGLLFFQSGNEFTIGGWLSTYLGESGHLSPRESQFALTCYWAAFMLGRLAASRWTGRLSSPALVTCSAVLGCLAVTGLILVPGGLADWIWVVLIGLGFAAIFPTTLAEAGAVFAQYSGTAFGAIFAMALCGGMTAPWVVGQIAQAKSIATGFWITAFSCAAIIVLQAVIRSRTGAADRHPESLSH
jgi:fucose permease